MEHRQPANTHQAQTKETSPFESFSDEEDILDDELDGLWTLASNLVEEWPNLCSRLIEHNLAETTECTTHFSNSAMVGYFTD